MNIHFSRILKLFLVLGLFLVLSVIVFNMISRSRSQVRIEREIDRSATERLESREKIKHFEVVKGAKKNFDFTAGRHYLGKDGLYHLEEDVHAVLTKRGNRKEIILEGSEVIHDKDRSFFRLTGKARIESEDLIATSSSIEYFQEKGVFSINEGVVFKSKKIEGFADRMEYSDIQQKIRLIDNVKIHMKINLEKNLPLTIITDMLEFRQKKKKGIAVGQVKLIQEKSTVSADQASFSLTKDGDYIKEMTLKGKVVAILSQDEQGETSEGAKSLFSLYESRREIRAKELVIRGFRDLSRIYSFRAKQDCSIRFISSTGKETQIQAGTLDFVLTRKGQLRALKALQKARIVEKDKDGKILILVVGDKIVLEGKRNVLNIKGGDGLIPRFKNQGIDITAGVISVNIKTGEFEASDDLKAILEMGGQDKKEAGLFSLDAPVFITAAYMRYFPKAERFQFKEKIKIWQAGTALQAEEIFLQEETGELQCSGKVSSTLMYQADENSPKRKIFILAEKMDYDPARKIMSYEEKGLIKVEDVSVEAEKIFVWLDAEKGGLLNILARDNVIFKQGKREGKAKEALYDLKKDVIILSGSPEINDLIKGKIQGDKLTFHMADDKIIVENKGKDRSVTVIK
jgi:lipopolysaccharide transport protein LptA